MPWQGEGVQVFCNGQSGTSFAVERLSRPQLLLRAESGVGHGARGARRAVGLATDILAFTAAQTGLTLSRDAS